MLQEGREESFPDMKKGLRGKFQNKKGFTLVEMLIVVAIIAILIAVSIPLMNGALETARHATDDANERAAKAAALLVYMGAVDAPAGVTYTPGTAVEDSAPWYYDAAEGNLKNAPDTIDPYGQCTGCGDTTNGYAPSGAPRTNQVIKITISEDGIVTMEWE